MPLPPGSTPSTTTAGATARSARSPPVAFEYRIATAANQACLTDVHQTGSTSLGASLFLGLDFARDFRGGILMGLWFLARG